MSIPQNLVDELLVKCGRRCCVCRRFQPLHLQVHHIVERGEGGSDAPDNLIAVCLTCHSDIHTKTQLSRRFTVAELKGHREALIAAVAKGTLPQGTAADDFGNFADNIVAKLIGQGQASSVDSGTLSAGAVEMLLGGVTNGWIADSSNVMHNGITADDIRSMSRAKKHLDELIRNDLVWHSGGILYCLSNEGFLLADQLLAAVQQNRG